MSSGWATTQRARSQVSSSGSSGAGIGASMARTYAASARAGSDPSAREGEAEPAALARGGAVDPDRAAVTLHDLAAGSQPDAVARCAAVHLRVHREDAVAVLGRDAEGVVGDGDQPVDLALLDADLATRCALRVAVLEGVLDQVLQHLAHP